MSAAADSYLDAVDAVTDRIRQTQIGPIDQAAQICARTIADGGVVHLFGTGHSRMMVEEIFPRHGSFPGFHAIVELALTNHTQVVGANGQRQAMFIEKTEGFGKVVLSNFDLVPVDAFMVFSNSGVNEVVVEVALEAKDRGLPVIAVVSVDHCSMATARHSSGKRLIDIADVVVDTCVPAGDAMVNVEGLDDPVGPGSTVGGAVVVNMIKCAIAEILTDSGSPPTVLTSSHFIGPEKSAEQFRLAYEQYRRDLVKALGHRSDGQEGR